MNKKRVIGFCIFLFFMFFVYFIQEANAIGLGSITKNIYVENGTAKTIDFYVLNTDKQEGVVELNIKGLLKNFIFLSDQEIYVDKNNEFYRISAFIKMDSCVIKPETDDNINTYISASLKQNNEKSIGAVAQATLRLSLILDEKIYCNHTKIKEINETYFTQKENNSQNNSLETKEITTIKKEKSNENEDNETSNPKKNITTILIISTTAILLVLILSSLFVFDVLYLKKKENKIKKNKKKQIKIADSKESKEVIDTYLNSLRAYIKKMKNNGYSNEKIKKNLLSVGWNENLIDKELKMKD